MRLHGLPHRIAHFVHAFAILLAVEPGNA